MNDRSKQDIHTLWTIIQAVVIVAVVSYLNAVLEEYKKAKDKFDKRYRP